MFFPLHILLMVTAALGIIIGVSTAIFFRKKSNWLKIHKSVNSFCLLGIAAGIIMAIFYVFSTGGKHIAGAHQFVGLAAFTFVNVTLLLGFSQFKATNKLAMRVTHRLLGRFSLVLLLTAIMLGLKLIHII